MPLGERERRAERTRRVLGIVLISIMLLSTAGYTFYYATSSNEQTVNDGTFTFDGVYWSGTTRYGSVYLTNNPSELNNTQISLPRTTISTFGGKTVYLDVKNPYYQEQLVLNLGPFMDLKQACYGPCEQDLPERNCSSPMIVWKVSENNRIYEQESCVFIEGDSYAVDSFIYQILK